MHLTHRPYDDVRGDFRAMWRLLQHDYAVNQDRFVWMVCRLGDWRHGLWGIKLSPFFHRRNAELWFNPFDELVGFAMDEDGGPTFFIMTRPDYTYVYAEILDWIIAHWGPRFPKLRAEVHEYQEEALCLLAERGFTKQRDCATTRQYDVAAQAQCPIELPPGFQVVDMAGRSDWRAKALVMRNGFGGENVVSEQDLWTDAFVRESPAYDPALDISVINAVGVHVSSCVGFVDTENRVAEIEKVCTHDLYRRRGLAEACIRGCFQRLHRRGITVAYITAYGPGADALYGKLGAIKARTWFHYELG